MVMTYDERAHKEAAELAEKLGQSKIYYMQLCTNDEPVDVKPRYCGFGSRVCCIDLSDIHTRVKWFKNPHSAPYIYANGYLFDSKARFFRTAEDAMQDARDWKARGEIDLTAFWVGGAQ